MFLDPPRVESGNDQLLDLVFNDEHIVRHLLVKADSRGTDRIQVSDEVVSVYLGTSVNGVHKNSAVSFVIGDGAFVVVDRY
jgi:hypothetical protein